MSIILNSSGGGSVTIQEPTTASNFTQTLPAATGTLVLSGTTPSFNGIAFPATQSASADANTLDDYEEGTWTPTITFGGGSTGITYSAQVASYTKIGNKVYIQGYISLSSKGSSTGAAKLTSLPFTSKNTTNLYSSATQGWYVNLTIAQSVIFDLVPNSTVIDLEYLSATSVTAHSNTTFNNNTAFEFSFFYETA
jgi:hypothetical protein